MNKLFRPKCMRRILLCLALMFPIVYLCGGLFFALAGAHGENVLATEETSIVDYQNITFNQLVNDDDGTYFESESTTRVFFWVDVVPQHKYVVKVNNNQIVPQLQIWESEYNTNAWSISPNNVGHGMFTRTNDVTSIVFEVTNYNYLCMRTYEFNDTNQGGYLYLSLYDLTLMYGYGNEPILDDFNEIFPKPYYPYTLGEFLALPIYGVPSEQNSLFFHVFGQRNFISQLGIDLINDSKKGFNPMNELFRTINTNIMHFEATDGLAMFGLGYVYYAVNVLIVYEVLVIAMKLLMLPLRAVDLFDKEEKL